jgi:hypothetical protein
MVKHRITVSWTMPIAGVVLLAVSLPLASIALAAVGFALLAEAVWMRTGPR